MSATRLLVLGLVRAYGRTHGYPLGLELSSWGAAEWANTKWGSLYHALRQLTKKEMLRSFEVEKCAHYQARTEYEITDKGEIEFFSLLREALRKPEFHMDSLCAALAMLSALPRTEAISLLTQRLEALEARRGIIAEQAPDRASETVLGSVQELFHLWALDADKDIDWTRSVIERLKTGSYVMAGEGKSRFGESRPDPTPH